jgi:hypothetical protein
VSLFSILGTNDWSSVGRYLKEFYVDNADETRRRAHCSQLDAFYEGKGDEEMERVVETVFKDTANAQRRKDFIKANLDKYNNLIARIAVEKATVYNEPPRRTIDVDNEKYQAFLDLVQMDDAMSELDKKLAYLEDALLWYRVREKPTGEREPLLEVVSPASFWAVCHPKDRTLLVAIIFDQRMPMAKPEDPSFRVWTDDETFVMNGKCEVFEGSVEAWPLGVMPGVLCSTRKPGTKPTLLAQCPGADLLSAQKNIRLQDIGLAKESASANKQAYVSGDTSATAMGQQADSDSHVFLGEGVTVNTVDRGVPTATFTDAASYVVDSVAANHGLPPSALHQRDASSGAEVELRNLPIRAMRKKRIPTMRRIEKSIARVMSLVNGALVTMGDAADPERMAGDLVDFAFSMEGWSIDFGEIQQPMTRAEENANFETERRLGLTSNYEEEMRRNPDLKTIEDAKAIVDQRLEWQTLYVASQKELMALNGSLGSATGEPTPQENGAMGPQAKSDKAVAA